MCAELHPDLQNILAGVETLAPFPHIAVRVLELSFQPEIVPAELVEVVETDVGITAKVLREANSALQGGQVDVRTLRDAGNRLGTRRLVAIVMKSCAADRFGGLGTSTERSNRSLWEESLTTAIAARLVAQLEGSVQPDLAYTVGLLQNMGYLLLDRFLAKERDAILAAVEGSGDERLLEAERAVLGIDHAQLGARLAEKWGFPSELRDAIAHHHAPQESAVTEALCSVAHRAEALTWGVLSTRGAYAVAYGLGGEDAWRELFDGQDVSALTAKITSELEEQGLALSGT